MKKYKIIFNDYGTSVELEADMFEMEADIVKFYSLGSLEPVAVFNMNEILGFMELETV